MSGDDGRWPLAGPRGRRCCWSLLSGRLSGPAWWAVTSAGTFDVSALLGELTAAITATAPPRLLSGAPRALLIGLQAATEHALYWQEPYSEDRALAMPEITRALAPVAEAVADAAPGWWSGPVDLATQRMVEWTDPEPVATDDRLLSGVAEALAGWREATLRDERRAGDLPTDVRAPYSGSWWSTPSLAGVPTTTRSLPDLGPVGLMCVEDGHGWTAARCVPVAPTRPPKVFDIDAARDWVELVDRYPLEVTASRRHDWWRATDAEGRWLIPDYQAVSHDYDAVHLTARGYLAAAGVAHAVAGARTVLAGWDPDQTYWLTDCLARTAAPERWVRCPDADEITWARKG